MPKTIYSIFSHNLVIDSIYKYFFYFRTLRTTSTSKQLRKTLLNKNRMNNIHTTASTTTTTTSTTITAASTNTIPLSISSSTSFNTTTTTTTGPLSSSSSTAIPSSSSSSSYPTYTIFCDLDGVLADFEYAAYQVLGYSFPSRPDPNTNKQEYKQAIAVAWETLQFYRHPQYKKGFFTTLPWMKDGPDLWNQIKQFNPIILTGMPRGNWARNQKIEWCNTQLGQQVPVIVCMKPEKARKAFEYVQQYKRSNHIGILIDDTADASTAWTAMGGIFIHHTNTINTLQQLRKLGYPC